MRKVTYLAVFEPSGTGYGVYFPDLLGCTSYGDTFETAQKEAADALALHIYGLEKAGDEIPTPSANPCYRRRNGGGIFGFSDNGFS